MKLIGVLPVSELVVSNLGRTYFKFMYNGTLLTTRTYRKYLESIGSSQINMILDINNLTIEDIPLCKICNINRVRIEGNPNHRNRINILSPEVGEVCSSKCSNILSSKRAILTQLKNGTHHLSNLSKSDRSVLCRTAANTRLKDGTHLSQTYGLIQYEGMVFKSKIELKVYNRYRRLLNKYYLREVLVSEYIINSKIKSYIADYVLKSECINKIKLPQVIEIKSGNIIKDQFHGSKMLLINKLKFSSVIQLNKSLLLIDNNSKYLLNSIEDIDNLFNKLIKN